MAREAGQATALDDPRLHEEIGKPEFSNRVRSGDSRAIRAVVRAYLPQILRTARGAGLPADRAKDVAQETFRTFIESAPRFEGRSHVRTWLFGILYKKIAEERRDLARERRFEEVDEHVEARFDAAGEWVRPPRPTDASVLDAEIRAAIEACLERAPSRQRMAFVLREVEGLSTGEICKILDVTRTNLGVMLYRVRNRLRECLEAKGIG